MIDPENEIMYTTLYNIACGNTVKTRAEIIRLAARAIEQITKLRSQQIMRRAEQKAAEEDMGIEIDLDEVVQK